MVGAETGVEQVLVHLVDDKLGGQLGHGGIVVQAGSAGDLEVIEFELLGIVIVVAHLGEEKFVVVDHNVRHELVVCFVQHGRFLRVDRHVVAVHVDAVIIGADEEECALHIDAGDHHDIDLVEDVLTVLAAELLNHDEARSHRRQAHRGESGPAATRWACRPRAGSWPHRPWWRLREYFSW